MKKNIVVSSAIVLCILYLTSFSLIAQDNTTVSEAFATLIQAKTLKCVLGKGCNADWDTGDPNLEIRKWSNSKDDCVLLFDSIDLKKGTARLIGHQGATDVTVFPTVSGITFIETTDWGNVNITTVFANYKKGTKDFIFVHSRHMTITTPLPSQYHGICELVLN